MSLHQFVEEKEVYEVCFLESGVVYTAGTMLGVLEAMFFDDPETEQGNLAAWMQVLADEYGVYESMWDWVEREIHGISEEAAEEFADAMVEAGAFELV